MSSQTFQEIEHLLLVLPSGLPVLVRCKNEKILRILLVDLDVHVKKLYLMKSLRSHSSTPQRHSARFDCRNGFPVVENTYNQIYRSFESGVSKDFSCQIKTQL